MRSPILIGTPPIEVHLRRSARARRYSLKVSSATGKVSLTLPGSASSRAALDFAVRQEGWLRQALARQPLQRRPAFDGHLLFEGDLLAVRRGGTRRIATGPDGLLFEAPPDTVAPRLAAWLKARARDRLAERCDAHAARLGAHVAALSLRDPKTRWGSCSAEGRLMFSWRLIMAPPAVLDYVAAHEVAHLAEMNHSDRFWAVVARLLPGYEAPRGWLKREGAGLHAWDFSRGA